MDYSIEIETLTEAIKQTKDAIGEIQIYKEQIYMVCSLLTSIGWIGESAELFEQSCDGFDARIDAYKERSIRVCNLLQHLHKDAQAVNNQANALTTIWNAGHGDVVTRTLKALDRFNVMSFGEAGTVSLDRSSANKAHSLCRKLHNTYEKQEEKAKQIRALHSACSEGFGTIGYIYAAVNEINLVKEKLELFDKCLQEYEDAVNQMEKKAQSAASDITPAIPFEKR